LELEAVLLPAVGRNARRAVAPQDLRVELGRGNRLRAVQGWPPVLVEPSTAESPKKSGPHVDVVDTLAPAQGDPVGLPTALLIDLPGSIHQFIHGRGNGDAVFLEQILPVHQERAFAID